MKDFYGQPRLVSSCADFVLIILTVLSKSGYSLLAGLEVSGCTAVVLYGVASKICLESCKKIHWHHFYS